MVAQGALMGDGVRATGVRRWRPTGRPPVGTARPASPGGGGEATTGRRRSTEEVAGMRAPWAWAPNPTSQGRGLGPVAGGGGVDAGGRGAFPASEG